MLFAGTVFHKEGHNKFADKAVKLYRGLANKKIGLR
jgi:hypothetical protein